MNAKIKISKYEKVIVMHHFIIILIMLFGTLQFVVKDSFAAFSNNFDGVSTSTPDVTWGLAASCGSCVGAPPAISADIANSPPNSLKFSFVDAPGNAALADSGQVFNFPTGKQEVWVQWWQYFPCSGGVPATCTDATNWQQNPTTSAIEFIKLWRGNSEQDVNALRSDMLFYPNGATGDSIIRPFFYPGNAPSIADDLLGVRQSNEKGDWVRFLYHVKGADNSAAPYDDGVIELGIYDGAVYDQRIYETTVPLIEGDLDNAFEHGKFMGRAQGGFSTAPVVTYIDDVFIADRPPFSMSLVLDRSGSMNGLIDLNDAAKGTKFAALQQAATATLDALDDYVTFADKLAVVYFNHDAIPSVIPADQIVFEPTTDITNLKASVTAETGGGGATSIGDAFLRAKNNGFDLYANPKEIIFLFTDGHQTASEYVVEDLTFDDGLTRNFNIGNSKTSGGSSFDASPYDIDICVVAIGSGITAQNTYFNNKLAEKRCDIPAIQLDLLLPSTPTALATTFTTHLISV